MHLNVTLRMQFAVQTSGKMHGTIFTDVACDKLHMSCILS